MKIKLFLKYAISTVMVCMLVMAAIYLPQYYSRMWDSRYLNSVTLVDREKNDMSYNYDTSLENKLRILMQAEREGKLFNPVRQTKENVVSEKKLIEGLKNELVKMEECGLLPELKRFSLDDNFLYADLYSVSDERDKENPNANVLFWYMRFSDYETFDFTFCVDAYTYTVYNAEIGCEMEEVQLYDTKINDMIMTTDLIDVLGGFKSYFDTSEGYYISVNNSNYVHAAIILGDVTVPVRKWFDATTYNESLSLPVLQIGIAPIQDWMFNMTTSNK